MALGRLTSFTPYNYSEKQVQLSPFYRFTKQERAKLPTWPPDPTKKQS